LKYSNKVELSNKEKIVESLNINDKKQIYVDEVQSKEIFKIKRNDYNNIK